MRTSEESPRNSGTRKPVVLALVGSLALPGVVNAQKPVPTPAGVPAKPRPAAPAASDRVSVNFSSTEVRDVLAVVAEHSGSDILVTPGATGKVSINLRNRPSEEVIKLVAASAGLSVLHIGNSYIVGPPVEVRRAAAGLGSSVVVPLQHLVPADAVEALGRVSPNVSVEPLKTGVVLSGLPSEIQAAQQTLLALDVRPPQAPVVPPKTEVAVKAVRYFDAEVMVKVLKEAFPELKVTRQDRTLILTGTSVEVEGAGRAIQGLDLEPPAPVMVQAPPEPRETLVYKLKYLNARKAEESLKKVFPNLTISAAPEANAPRPAAFQPLSLGTLGGSGGGGGGAAGGGGFPTGAGGASATGGSGAGGAVGDDIQPLSRSTQLIMVGTREEIANARNLLDETDIAPPRVNIEAELIEINNSNADDLGINWDFSRLATTVTAEAGDLLRFGTVSRSAARITVALEALVRQNRARVLARPNISVVDNEDANIFIGDLIRFRGINVVTPDVGTVQGTETIPVGIALLVRPRIHPDGAVTLKVHPVISSVSQTVDGLPQTASREADTTVRLMPGETLAIGGLQRTETLHEVRKVPGLGDLPIFGQFFRARTRRNAKSEIIILIRTRPAEDAPQTVGASESQGAPK